MQPGVRIILPSIHPYFRRVSFKWHMTMDGKYVILLLLSAFLRSQAVITANKSFSLCNTTEGIPACALDTPDKRITLRPEFNPAICPEVLCAWECREDLQCLEFNVHINNRTCDLHYNQPMNYQSTTDCRHFQVIPCPGIVVVVVVLVVVIVITTIIVIVITTIIIFDQT